MAPCKSSVYEEFFLGVPLCFIAHKFMRIQKEAMNIFFMVKERNAIAEIIMNHGLTTSDFEMINTSLYLLTHEKTGFEFVVSPNPNHDIIAGPFNIETKPDRIVSGWDAKGKYWDEVLSAFQRWISLVQEEMEVPDLWSSAQKSGGFLSSNDNLPNDKFLPEEIHLLFERVQSVEERIKSLNISEEATRDIIEVVRDVPNEAKFFTKKKLAEVVIGQIISQGLKWGLTTENMQAIWHAFQGFTYLFIG